MSSDVTVTSHECNVCVFGRCCKFDLSPWGNTHRLITARSDVVCVGGDCRRCSTVAEACVSRE